MAITPNYSWPLPDNTDLVKNGAEAIRDLGNAIDNTVENLPSGALVHINSTTMSAVATQSINDVFSSTFTNYLIIGEFLMSSSNVNLTMRLRASGADNLTSNYSHGTIRSIQASSVTSSITANGTSWRLTDNIGVGNRGLNLQIYNPNIARATVLNGTIAANRFPHINSNIFQPTTSFDGFTLIPGAGNITGQINIYGLKD